VNVFVWHLIGMLFARDHTVLPPPNTGHACLNFQPHSIITHWLVLIVPTHGGMARLSSPGRLVVYEYVQMINRKLGCRDEKYYIEIQFNKNDCSDEQIQIMIRFNSRLNHM